jgi:hypothetical protein
MVTGPGAYPGEANGDQAKGIEWTGKGLQGGWIHSGSQNLPFGGDENGGGPVLACDGVELGIGPRWPVMEEHEPAGVRVARQPQRLVDRCMTEEVGYAALRLKELRIVEEQVDSLEERNKLVGATLGRGVVGDVGHRTRLILDAITERPSAFVCYLRRGDAKSSDREHLRLQGVERPPPPQSFGGDREAGRRHHLGQQISAAEVVLCRKVEVDDAVRMVASNEERDSLHVVPMQVAQEDGALKARARKQARDRAQPGPGIEHEGGHVMAMGGECHARRMAAVPDEVGPRGGGRTTNTEQPDLHELITR